MFLLKRWNLLIPITSQRGRTLQQVHNIVKLISCLQEWTSPPHLLLMFFFLPENVENLKWRGTRFLFSLNCYWFNFSVSFRFRKRSMEVCPRFIWECHIWGTRWQYLRCRGAPLVSAAVFWTSRVSWTGDSELNEMTRLSRKLHSALPFKMHL